MKFDAVVVGGGIIGCTHAYFLSLKGLKVAVVEKAAVGGGTTARNFSWINATWKTADADYYRLSAASLCCPSHWRLEEKFDRPMREIHDPIPDFHRELTPRIDRFFDHLKPEHPVQRFNWSVQEYDNLSQRPEHEMPIGPTTELFYRTERQTLLRLPQSDAIAFTIRVYLHPLDSLRATPGALPALFSAIDATPAALARYKGFDQLAPALARYREA